MSHAFRPDDTIDVAVVGCGEHMCATLGPALRATAGLSAVAACDLDPRRAQVAAELVGAKAAYTSLDELLAAERLAAIVAAGPPGLHAEVVERALERGISVFVEKPAAADADTVRELAHSARGSPATTLVGHNLRHSAAWSVVRSLAAEPAFGRATAAQLTYLASRPRGPRWGLDSGLRSFLLTHAIHPVDLAVSLFGAPVEVEARAQAIPADGLIVTAQLTFAGGEVATVVAGTAAPSLKLGATLIGGGSHIVEMHGLHRVTSTLGAAAGDSAFRPSTEWRVRTLDSGLATAGYHSELAAFRSAIATGAPASPSLSEVVPTYDALEAIEQAASRAGSPSAVGA
jgi:myo-inositol 2-dehydrogenase/D-chiro-inositol 1-dehydrogenase